MTNTQTAIKGTEMVTEFEVFATLKLDLSVKVTSPEQQEAIMKAMSKFEAIAQELAELTFISESGDIPKVHNTSIDSVVTFDEEENQY